MEATLQYFPSSSPALYQKSALAFWFLAKYFNEVKDTRQGQSLYCDANRQILSVGRLLRAIIMMDSGKLNDNSPTSPINTTKAEESGLRGDASLDTMNINFIMYEKRV